VQTRTTASGFAWLLLDHFVLRHSTLV
jgi:hypothetical protein